MISSDTLPAFIPQKKKYNEGYFSVGLSKSLLLLVFFAVYMLSNKKENCNKK